MNVTLYILIQKKVTTIALMNVLNIVIKKMNKTIV